MQDCKLLTYILTSIYRYIVTHELLLDQYNDFGAFINTLVFAPSMFYRAAQ